MLNLQTTLTPEILSRFPNAKEGFRPDPQYPLLDFILDANGINNYIVDISKPLYPYSNYGSANKKCIFTLPILTDAVLDRSFTFYKLEDSELVITATDFIHTDRSDSVHVISSNEIMRPNFIPVINISAHKNANGYFWQVGISFGDWVSTLK